MMRIRIYQKQELAKLYFPECSDHGATNSLLRMIKHCKPLMNELQTMGYNPHLKYFTTHQVDRITHFLGKPCD